MSANGQAGPVFQLRYISTQTSGDVAADVPGILAKSRERNRAAGVTGLLVYNGARFLQILEGPEASVRQTFDRIAADPRHYGIAILGTTTSDARAFRNWAMAYEALAAGAWQNGTLADMVMDLVSGAPDRIAREFLAYARLKPERAAG